MGNHRRATEIAQRALEIRDRDASLNIVTQYLLQRLGSHNGFPELRLVRLGSEQVTRNEFEGFRQNFSDKCTLVNALSCTEAITFCQNFLTRRSAFVGDIVPVGYPVPDMEVLLLDERGEIIEGGNSGEIAIRSEFLSPGYWRRPELTQKAFVCVKGDGGQRIYLTGDLGRIHPDGCLEHIGRKIFKSRSNEGQKAC